MPRVRRRPPAEREHRAAPEDRGSRAKLHLRLGWPPGVDHRRLDDPDYQRDVIEPYRRSIGWVVDAPGWAFGSIRSTHVTEGDPDAR